MKNSILLVLFLTSTLFAFSQTYPKYKNNDNTVLFQRTSSTTATLKFENALGSVVTKYLTNRSENNGVITYKISNGSYVKLIYMGSFCSGCHCYKIRYYNELDNNLWNAYVDTQVDSGNTTSQSQAGSITKSSSSNSQQTGCTSGNCENGFGTYKWPSGSIYKGNWVNGTTNGFGEFWSNDGSYYIGEFQNNVTNGKGKLTLPNGTVLEGYFENGVFKGVQNTTPQPTTPQPTTTTSFSFG